MMEHRIEQLPERKLIGMRRSMSYANNQTGALWGSFMPRRHEVMQKVTSEFISMQVFPPTFSFQQFDMQASFEKWACIEVNDWQDVPAGMETFLLPEGLHVVFQYKGLARDAAPAFRYIFETWLPQSDYVLDQRPHFERIGEKYKNDDPNSEEEIWIPIRAQKA